MLGRLGHRVGNIIHSAVAQIRERARARFVSRMTFIEAHPERVHSYFQDPLVKYAA